MSARTIPGTRRQAVKTADGLALQRQYVYLPDHAWTALASAARQRNQSVSQLIATFAHAGKDTSKEQYDSYRTTVSRI